MIRKKPETSCSAVVLSAIFFLIGAFVVVRFSIPNTQSWEMIIFGMVFMLGGIMFGISDGIDLETRNKHLYLWLSYIVVHLFFLLFSIILLWIGFRPEGCFLSILLGAFLLWVTFWNAYKHWNTFINSFRNGKGK